jgi:hypothetical protein
VYNSLFYKGILIMKIMKALIGSLLLAAVPLAAQAEGMSYSYVEAGYNEADIDGVESGDGFSVRGSAGFAENFFGFADYSTFGFSGGVDLDQWNVGIGGRLGISDNVDLVGRVGYSTLDLSVSGLGSGDESGYSVSAGIRGQVTDGFELEGHVIHTDLGSGVGDSTGILVGGRYFFTDNFAAGAEYRTGDDIAGADVDVIYAGVRFTF